MKKVWLFLLILVMPSQAELSQFRREVVRPIPFMLSDQKETQITLNGDWLFSITPSDSFWQPGDSLSSWVPIHVPGECVMQGYNIRQDMEFAYKRLFRIPPDWQGKRLFLRFDGVYSYARVWINGHYVRDHYGGFTSWDCEITPYVLWEKPNVLSVGVTDRSDDISWASNYAKHNIGGILRSVSLFAVPENHLTRIHVRTELDSRYRNAMVWIIATAEFVRNTSLEVRFAIFNPNHRNLKAKINHSGTFTLSPTTPCDTIRIPISSPVLWDAEHPNLYHMEIKTFTDGHFLSSYNSYFGIRKVEIKHRTLLVNGKPVILHGVNRHDIHPLYGRSLPPELDELDVRLFKEANINFVRTSHYPPSKTFLEACDHYGLYVEEETAVCFQGVWGNPASMDSSKYRSRYLSQFSEMVERDASHPSVIIWSLGNESKWGENFQLEADYLRSCEPTRPVIFSFPSLVPAGTDAYDIFSHHYVDFRENSSRFDLLHPILHDEFAHVACYNRSELAQDPNVRNFWGKSIQCLAEKLFTTRGTLGGAIWAGIDEVFQVPLDSFQQPDTTGQFSRYGYGPWGILDGWRRKKPEFWHVKKAFSPVRINIRAVHWSHDDTVVTIPVENRFDHTDLQEITAIWRCGTDSGFCEISEIPPHRSGTIRITAKNWVEKDSLQLIFLASDNRVIDEYLFPIIPDHSRKEKAKTGNLRSLPEISLRTRQNTLFISCADILWTISRQTGLLTACSKGNTHFQFSGPFLHCNPFELTNRRLLQINAHKQSDSVHVELEVAYDSLNVRYDYFFQPGGELEICARVDNVRYHHPVEGLREIGLAFFLPESVNRLRWDREALWTTYPADHIGRTRGTACKNNTAGVVCPGKKPHWPWAADMNDLFTGIQFGATNDFRSLKENIRWASVERQGIPGRLVFRPALHPLAIRLEVEPETGRIHGYLLNKWNYPNLKWGNFMFNRLILENGTTLRVRLSPNYQLKDSKIKKL